MHKDQLSIPLEAPVMVLPAVLFPGALMPLYIFEPRYRAMLQWSLENDRVFCIALQKPDAADTRSPDDFFHIAGLGLIRASVEREDGTSHLMLQGLCRARFAGFPQSSPFFIARIQSLPTLGTGEPGSPDFQAAALLADEVRGLCHRLRERSANVDPGVDAWLGSLDDPDVLADSSAHAFLQEPMQRQRILEEPDLPSRLRLLAGYLRSQLDRPE
jgi:Lon protease-like protein